MSGPQVNSTELTLSSTSHLSLPEQTLPPLCKPTALPLFFHPTPALVMWAASTQICFAL